MPASSSGLRRAKVWKTKANISMPQPAMAQAISAPAPPVARPKADGRAKMPEPIIEPTTRAMSARSESFWASEVVMVDTLRAYSCQGSALS